MTYSRKTLTIEDLKALLDPKGPKAVPKGERQYTPEQLAARKAEKSRRNTRARNQTYLALARLHADEYRQIYDLIRADMDETLPPLPGDSDE